MTIKAIETRYNGYRFRSRLEPRWAVFFDSLGIAYEYEKEGFALDGCFYLPDFWLPVWRTWVEVKSAAAAWPGDWQPCQSLALAGSPIMVLVGECWPGRHGIVDFPLAYSFDVGAEEKNLSRLASAEEATRLCGGYQPGAVWWNQFAGCRRCPGFCRVWADAEGSPFAHGNVGPHTCGDHDRCPRVNEQNGLLHAYEPARSARFEHGETPRPR